MNPGDAGFNHFNNKTDAGANHNDDQDSSGDRPKNIIAKGKRKYTKDGINCKYCQSA